MARDFNQNRIANAVLKNKKVNSVGNFYAFQDNADGYNVLNVESLPSVKLMTGINEDITEFAFFNDQNDYGGIGPYSLSALPKLKNLYIYQNSGSEDTLDIDLHAFETNTELEKIYVHPDMKAKYMNDYGSQIAYGTTTIGDLLDSYSLVNEFEIPTMLGGDIAPTTLTNAWVVRAINDILGNNQVWKNVITKIIVPSYFITIDSGAFNLANLNMNYVTELVCNGTKTFASGFLNGASWCKHLWLDNGSSTFSGAYVTDGTTVLNANFRTLAPYLVFANYFMSEYPSEYPVVGYNQFVGGDDLPRTSPTGEYLWFSNINFDADYNSPTGLENDDSYVSSYVASSSGYYYCYDKTEILVIQDDGTHILTSALVQSAINGLATPKEWIKEIKCVSSFEDVTDDCFDTIPQNVLDLEFPVKWLSGGIPSTYRNLPNVLSLGTIRNVTIKPTYNNGTFISNSAVNITGTLKFVGDKALNTSGYLAAFIQPSSIKIIDYSSVVLNCNLNNESNPNNYQLAPQVFMGCSNIEKLIFPASLQKTDTNVWSQQIGTNGMKVIFNSTQVITLGYVGSSWNRVSNFYVRANLLVDFMTSQWSNYANKFIGFLDYTDTVPTWTDYSATWYSDEDCTVQVLPANFVSGNRYYVKLA